MNLLAFLYAFSLTVIGGLLMLVVQQVAGTPIQYPQTDAVVLLLGGLAVGFVWGTVIMPRRPSA